MSSTRVTIFDTTLRDGEQAPGFSMRTDEKLKLAHKLAALGVDVIEAGFPIASDSDAEAVRMIATHVRGPVIAALARCNAADVERAAWALAPAPRRRIHIFIATSDLHLERKLRITRQECIDSAICRGSPRAPVHRRCAVLRGGRDAERSGVSVESRGSGDPGRSQDHQLARHGWLLDTRRDPATSSAASFNSVRTPTR